MKVLWQIPQKFIYLSRRGPLRSLKNNPIQPLNLISPSNGLFGVYIFCAWSTFDLPVSNNNKNSTWPLSIIDRRRRAIKRRQGVQDWMGWVSDLGGALQQPPISLLGHVGGLRWVKEKECPIESRNFGSHLLICKVPSNLSVISIIINTSKDDVWGTPSSTQRIIPQISITFCGLFGHSYIMGGSVERFQRGRLKGSKIYVE